MIDSVVRELTNHLPNLPWTVGLAVTQVPGEADVGRQAGERSRTTCNRHVRTGNVHAWPDDVAAMDGIAQGDVPKGAR